MGLRRMIGFSRIRGDHTGSEWNGIDPRRVPKNADSWMMLLAPRNASNMSSISCSTAAVKKHNWQFRHFLQLKSTIFNWTTSTFS